MSHNQLTADSRAVQSSSAPPLRQTLNNKRQQGSQRILLAENSVCQQQDLHKFKQILITRQQALRKFSEDLNDGPPRLSARLGPLVRASLGHSWSTLLSETYGGASWSCLRPNVTFGQDYPIAWLCQERPVPADFNGCPCVLPLDALEAGVNRMAENNHWDIKT